jgi:prevent-host-death family protein
MERKLGLAKARENFSEIVEQVQYQGESYVISRHGKPAAAVVPVEVYENWKRQRKAFFESVRKLQEANQKFDPDQVWKNVLQAQRSSRNTEE